MSNQVIPMDLARRRSPPQRKLGEVYGRVLSMDQLSPKVLQRQIQRQGIRELGLLHFLIKMSGGYLPPIPSDDQLEAFYEDGLEY